MLRGLLCFCCKTWKEHRGRVDEPRVKKPERLSPECDGAHDPPERALIFRKAVAGSHADCVEERPVVEQDRKERQPFVLPGRLRSVHEGGAKTLEAADVRAAVARRTSEIRIVVSQRGDELVDRRPQVMRLVSRYADLHA